MGLTTEVLLLLTARNTADAAIRAFGRSLNDLGKSSDAVSLALARQAKADSGLQAAQDKLVTSSRAVVVSNSALQQQKIALATANQALSDTIDRQIIAQDKLAQAGGKGVVLQRRLAVATLEVSSAQADAAAVLTGYTNAQQSAIRMNAAQIASLRSVTAANAEVAASARAAADAQASSSRFGGLGAAGGGLLGIGVAAAAYGGFRLLQTSADRANELQKSALSNVALTGPNKGQTFTQTSDQNQAGDIALARSGLPYDPNTFEQARYTVLSAGVNGANVDPTLKVYGQASAATGVNDINKFAALGTDLTDIFGTGKNATGPEAEALINQVLQAGQRGKVPVKDILANIGKFAGIGSTADFSLADQLTYFSRETAGGVGQRSGRSEAALFRALANPSKSQRSAAERYKVDINPDYLNANGGVVALADQLYKIPATAGDRLKVFSQVLGTANATAGFIGAFGREGQQIGSYRQYLKETQAAGDPSKVGAGDLLNTAYNSSATGTTQQLGVAQANLVATEIQIGKKLQPMINSYALLEVALLNVVNDGLPSLLTGLGSAGNALDAFVKWAKIPQDSPLADPNIRKAAEPDLPGFNPLNVHTYRLGDILGAAGGYLDGLDPKAATSRTPARQPSVSSPVPVKIIATGVDQFSYTALTASLQAQAAPQPETSSRPHPSAAVPAPADRRFDGEARASASASLQQDAAVRAVGEARTRLLVAQGDGSLTAKVQDDRAALTALVLDASSTSAQIHSAITATLGDISHAGFAPGSAAKLYQETKNTGNAAILSRAIDKQADATKSADLFFRGTQLYGLSVTRQESALKLDVAARQRLIDTQRLKGNDLQEANQGLYDYAKAGQNSIQANIDRQAATAQSKVLSQARNLEGRVNLDAALGKDPTSDIKRLDKFERLNAGKLGLKDVDVQIAYANEQKRQATTALSGLQAQQALSQARGDDVSGITAQINAYEAAHKTILGLTDAQLKLNGFLEIQRKSKDVLTVLQERVELSGLKNQDTRKGVLAEEAYIRKNSKDLGLTPLQALIEVAKLQNSIAKPVTGPQLIRTPLTGLGSLTATFGSTAARVGGLAADSGTSGIISSLQRQLAAAEAALRTAQAELTEQRATTTQVRGLRSDMRSASKSSGRAEPPLRKGVVTSRAG